MGKEEFKLTSEESFLQILDTIGDMVLVKGPKSKLLWANKVFCEFYGMTNEQLRGLIDAPFSEPDHTQKFVRDDAYVFSTGKKLDIPEEPVNRHDGIVRIFHTIKTPIFDNQGKVVMTVGISRDITDRKLTEEKLRFERERSTYSAKMASLGEMAGGIAHEINTPLAVISMLAGQSADLFGDDKPDYNQIMQNISVIEKTTQKIAKIIVGLRAFSRDGKNDPLVATKISQIIEDTLSFSKERIVNHDIELEVANLSEGPELVVDCRASELGQVLLNLLNNAHDAVMEYKGKKWIKIETLRVENNMIEISITDCGPGIPKKNRENLFNPFFTTKEIGKGTGLGLSISKGLVEAHGGTIFLDETCANTRFAFRLPLKNI